MNFLLDKWRNISTKLYLALAFAVLLTLISSAVGVYYFERSGNLNYDAKQQSVPVLEAAWDASRQAKEMRAIGLETISGTGNHNGDDTRKAISLSLNTLREALRRTSSTPGLYQASSQANNSAQQLANTANALVTNRTSTQEAGSRVSELNEILTRLGDAQGAGALREAMATGDADQLETGLREFTHRAATGLPPPVVAAAGGNEGVYATKRLQLALEARKAELTALFEQRSSVLESDTSTLLEQAQTHARETLDLSVQSFDEGRILLATISMMSMISATIAAWFWVGNAVVRRLSHLSERMRGMAQGDLETPVPEVGSDEIGQLADALEHFRQQALEVQRLNLVEQLYRELQQANEELQRMQARLVAQEKLAALGELVSGVAHEISNPLNFVKNFSEGSLDLYKELAEMLENYRDRLSEDDASLLDELTGEITEALGRVSYNGGRALAIVQRMQSLSATPGTPQPSKLNTALQQAVNQGYQAFTEEIPEFQAVITYDLDPDIEDAMLSERDFSEAIINLVTNACHAMAEKKKTQDDEYAPTLAVTSQLNKNTIDVRIRDNGTGVDERVRDRIFNPFVTTQDGTMGAGLGLTIASDIARRHDGELTFETETGLYTEFTLKLRGTADQETPADIDKGATVYSQTSPRPSSAGP